MSNQVVFSKEQAKEIQQYPSYLYTSKTHGKSKVSMSKSSGNCMYEWK